MRHTRYKIFLATEYDKEEQWLNEMSAKGLGLVSVNLIQYIFEDQVPCKYTYKLELLSSLPSTTKNTSYLLFLEEAGVEHIASVFRWVYLRKKVEDGAFDLYSDVSSTISYLQRLQRFYIFLTILEFAIGIMNFSIGLSLGNLCMANIFFGFFLTFLGVLLAIAAYKHTVKIRILKKENQIRE